jgi:hypothetical protein
MEERFERQKISMGSFAPRIEHGVMGTAGSGA